MKPRTRIIAWLHILADIPAVLWVLALAAFGGGLLAGLIKPDTPLPLADRVGAGRGLLTYALIISAIALLDMYPWIALLRKKRWAWWLLTIVYGLGMASSVRAWIPAPKAGKEFTDAVLNSAGVLIYFGITFLILVTDRPKQRKTPTRRRRRTSKRRYARRRRYTYDY